MIATIAATLRRLADWIDEPVFDPGSVIEVTNHWPVVELAADGLPVAASVRPGLGLPVIAPGQFRVFLNGKEARAVAFDRRTGVVWAYETNDLGRIIAGDDGKAILCKHYGHVTIQPIGGAGDQ